MILHKDHAELEMRYEGYSRAIFECPRGTDPWGISDANFFHFKTIEGGVLIPDERTIRQIITIIDVAIWKHRGHVGFVKQMLSHKEAVLKIETQDEAAELIDKLIALAEGVGY